MIKKFLLNTLVSILLITAPTMGVFADEPSNPAPSTPTDPTTTSTDTSSQTPAGPSSVAPANTGVQSPTGADASTYTYNESTGLWENAYYTWNPTTHQTSPKTSQDYSYNPATGMWDTTQWVYDAPSGAYVPNVVSVADPPVHAATISDSGPSTDNTVNQNVNNSGAFDLFFDASISNKITQLAASGDASVTGNTIGGSALSGNAVDVSNIINMLQSSWALQPAQNLLTFTKNIDGDVTGDIVIDPSVLSSGPLSLNNVNANTNNNLTINSKADGLIDNDITLGVTSGNANVSGNTKAGSATSGNADAVANIVNVLNSAIAANKSFLGVININGNLNGDILLPANFIDQLIASSAPSATVNISGNSSSNLTADLKDTKNINNNVNLTAVSGNANVSGNTNAGNANTGSASTNLTVFNLTGRDIVGANSLLVFVNVMGRWVGLIMDAPQGSNSAALCGGSCNINANTSSNVAINSTSNSTINNNLKINSMSGDANVSGNNTAGDATTGSATASANLANIINSRLNLSDWFGILFINVLGSWDGSFGVNTSAGNLFGPNAGGNGSGPATTIQAFRFVPSESAHNFYATAASGSSDNSDSSSDKPVVLASSIGNHIKPIAKAGSKGVINMLIPTITFFAIIGLFTAAGMTEYIDRLRMQILNFRLNRG